jgi:hypothetical protein
LTCNSEVDVVLLLDGSGSLGRRGWKVVTATAAAIAMALKGSNGTRAKLVVTVFSGPDQWSDIDKCLFPSRDSMGLACGTKPLTHFSENKNMDETVKLILARSGQPGGGGDLNLSCSEEHHP